jgi:hypothetical protein
LNVYKQTAGQPSRVSTRRNVSIRECLTNPAPKDQISSAILTYKSVDKATPKRRPPHRRGYVLNALAFSTLLSSQGTDAHHQQPPGRLQGNYSNLPDAFPTRQIRALNGFWGTSGRSARPPKPYPTPDGACARYPKLNCPGGSRRNRFAERHSIPIRAAVQAPFPAPWCGRSYLTRQQTSFGHCWPGRGLQLHRR